MSQVTLLLPRLLVPVRPRMQVLEQMAVAIEGETRIAGDAKDPSL